MSQMPTNNPVMPAGTPVAPAPRPAKSWNVANVLVIVAALLMVVAYFLPYMSVVGEENRALLTAQPDLEIVFGLTLGSIADPSLFDLTRLISNLTQVGYDAATVTIVVVVFVAVVVLPAIALLFALFRKSIPVIVFSALAVGLWAFLNAAFSSADAWNELYGAGIGYWLYLAAAIAAIVFAIWALVLRHRAKVASSRMAA